MGTALITASDAAWPWSNTLGVSTLVAEILGGGGGGGGVSNNTEGCGGGGRGGSYVRVTITRGTESTLNLTVGAAGSAGNAAGAAGGNGGPSSVVQDGVTRGLAPGGNGGGGGTANAEFAGGTTDNGSEVHGAGVYFAGGSGATGSLASNYSGGGGGAAGPSGAGGTTTSNAAGARGTGTWADGSTTRNTAGAAGRITTANAGVAASNYGGAGSGGYALGSTNRAGGAGGAGVILLSWEDDVTGPTLSSPSVGSITTTGGTPSVSTNEATGTAYMVVVPNGDSPSVAQIKAGQRSNGTAAIAASNQAVTATGVQTFAAVSGLTPGTTYDVWFVHTDVATNNSTAATTEFTTDTAPADLNTLIRRRPTRFASFNALLMR